MTLQGMRLSRLSGIGDPAPAATTATGTYPDAASAQAAVQAQMDQVLANANRAPAPTTVSACEQAKMDALMPALAVSGLGSAAGFLGGWLFGANRKNGFMGKLGWSLLFSSLGGAAGYVVALPFIKKPNC